VRETTDDAAAAWPRLGSAPGRSDALDAGSPWCTPRGWSTGPSARQIAFGWTDVPGVGSNEAIRGRLLEDVGRPRVVEDVPEELVRRVLSGMRGEA